MALVNGQNFGYCIYLIVSSGYTAFFSSCHVAYILAKFHISLSSLWYCCDQKSQAASAQSFTLWQQATIEITC